MQSRACAYIGLRFARVWRHRLFKALSYGVHSYFCIFACCAIRRRRKKCKMKDNAFLKVLSRNRITSRSTLASFCSFNAGDMPDRLHYRCLSHNVLHHVHKSHISFHRVRIAPHSHGVIVSSLIGCDSNILSHQFASFPWRWAFLPKAKRKPPLALLQGEIHYIFVLKISTSTSRINHEIRLVERCFMTQ